MESETTTGDPEDDGQAFSSGDDPATAPIIATIELEGGLTIEFVAVGESTIGIAVGGPIDTADVDAVTVAISQAASPLDLYEEFADVDAAAPEELVDLSEAVVESGNWTGCTSDEAPSEAPKSLRAQSSGMPHVPPASGGPDALTSRNDPQTATCDYLVAYGDNLPGNNGNCTLYYRDSDENTEWNYSDINAFAGHVIGSSGVVLWTVSHQNWGVGDWYEDYQRVISQGYHYYYYEYDNNDDFNVNSHVDSLSEGGAHYHDVARIHDWYHRVINMSYWDQGHWINYNGSELYCTDTPYEGADPSNIPTGGSWEGYNEADC